MFGQANYGAAKTGMLGLMNVLKHEGVWICRRVDIARHWMATHPYRGSSR